MTVLGFATLVLLVGTLAGQPLPDSPDIEADYEDEEEFRANYHGSFDSMGGEGWEDESPEFDHNYFDNAFEETEEDLLQFSEHMADFMPDESFNFDLESEAT